jgi:beta-N-acetylglucosaminidase
MERYIRKYKHISYLQSTIRDLHWEIINATMQSTNIGWTENTTKYMVNCAKLIRKYERRLKLLKY